MCTVSNVTTNGKFSNFKLPTGLRGLCMSHGLMAIIRGLGWMDEVGAGVGVGGSY